MATEQSVDFEAYKSVVEAAKAEILAKIPKPDPVGWKLVTLVLPVILTSILGTIVFRMQSDINSRLSLTQDYYRRRLEVYGKLYESLASIKRQAENALNRPTTTTGLDDTIVAFGDSYSANTIYLTQALINAVDEMWRDSSRAVGEPVFSPESLKVLRSNAARIEKQMRSDLVVD
jgi:hypothetical protein